MGKIASVEEKGITSRGGFKGEGWGRGANSGIQRPANSKGSLLYYFEISIFGDVR